MPQLKTLRGVLQSDLGLLLLLALARLALHTLTNHQYGFHQDELATLANARHLAWGYVAYPPLTPFVARVALELFGPSLVGIRFFSALAQCAGMVLTGLMARELGGSRTTQVVAALAAAIAPFSLIQAALFQYVSFDYLWGVSIAYCALRLLKTEDPRWWLGIGAAIGLGMMTRYSMSYYVVGLVGAVLLTPARRYLASRWLWAGVGLSLLIFLPNLIWQAQHHFISLEFLSAIHARDVQIGRADGFLIEQLVVPASTFTITWWAAGLAYYFFNPAGRRYRLLGWLFVIPVMLYLVTQGRSYYTAPYYPMLLAGGAVLGEGWVRSLSRGWARVAQGAAWVALAGGAVFSGALMLPIAPINSGWWQTVSEVHDNFVAEIGWPELAQAVADVYASLPEADRAHTAIITAHYGQAGAIDLYGPAYGLPEAISPVNSFWLRGYGDPPPQALIVVGYPAALVPQYLEGCEEAGRITNAYGVPNEVATANPVILVCGPPRMPWPEFWETIQTFA